MPYIPFRATFTVNPVCVANMKQALIRIGEIDPHEIKKHNEKLHGNSYCSQERALFNRGVLNVRKSLDPRHPKSRKYTMKAVKMTSRCYQKGRFEGSSVFECKLPQKKFAAIVVKTYQLLYKYDRKLCNKLLNVADSDKCEPKFPLDSIILRTLIPIPAQIVFRKESAHATDGMKDVIHDMHRI